MEMDSGFGTGSKQNHHLSRMLNDGVNSDAIIKACDGEIKCHKFILTGQSDVFVAMFKHTTESQEFLSGVVSMEEMSTHSVRAFLAFLYLDEIQNASENSEVALDLLKAGHCYQIPSMVEQMKKIFCAKPIKWFSIEIAMKLYFHAKILEDGEALKRKALEVMKLNYSKLNELPAYIKLFEEEPKAARELCSDLIIFQQPIVTVAKKRPFHSYY